MLSLLWQFYDILGLIFIVPNGPILKIIQPSSHTAQESQFMIVDCSKDLPLVGYWLDRAAALASAAIGLCLQSGIPTLA